MLHAASGKVSSQSQLGDTRITADKAITVASVTKAITVAAKQHFLLTAQGAYLKLEGGNIMLHGPGKVEFKAMMKELAGPQSAPSALPSLPKAENLKNFVELNHHWPDLTPVAGGAWTTPAQQDSRRFFKAGEVMPKFEGSSYGARIWQWSEEQ